MAFQHRITKKLLQNVCHQFQKTQAPAILQTRHASPFVHNEMRLISEKSVACSAKHLFFLLFDKLLNSTLSYCDQQENYENKSSPQHIISLI